MLFACDLCGHMLHTCVGVGQHMPAHMRWASCLAALCVYTVPPYVELQGCSLPHGALFVHLTTDGSAPIDSVLSVDTVVPSHVCPASLSLPSAVHARCSHQCAPSSTLTLFHCAAMKKTAAADATTASALPSMDYVPIKTASTKKTSKASSKRASKKAAAPK